MSSVPKTNMIMKNSTSAPIVYLDWVQALGIINGVVELECAAQVLVPKENGQVQADTVCTAHLRCSVAAANNLMEAIGKALAMLQAPQGKTN